MYAQPNVRQLVQDTTRAFNRRRLTVVYSCVCVRLFAQGCVTDRLFGVQSTYDHPKLHNASKYHISAVPSSTDDLLCFHCGGPIPVARRGLGNRSRRDFVGIYLVRFGDPLQRR